MIFIGGFFKKEKFKGKCCITYENIATSKKCFLKNKYKMKNDIL